MYENKVYENIKALAEHIRGTIEGCGIGLMPENRDMVDVTVKDSSATFDIKTDDGGLYEVRITPLQPIEIIETRFNSDFKYLVSQGSSLKGAWLWQKAEFTHEIGDGKKAYYFEAAGRSPSPFVQALIKADSAEEAEELIQETFGESLKKGSLIRQSKVPVRLIDERTKSC